MTSVQQNYDINPSFGFVGQIAEPNSPNRVEAGILYVASGDSRSNPRPGDAVYWDTGNNAWRVPHSAATRLRQSGILTYRQDDVANTSDIVQFESGDQIFVVTQGVVWVTAGGAVERTDQVVMQTDDFKWDAQTRVAAIADMYTNPMECFSRDGVDTSTIKVAVGLGRAI